jgi:hypothetical protein
VLKEAAEEEPTKSTQRSNNKVYHANAKKEAGDSTGCYIFRLRKTI